MAKEAAVPRFEQVEDMIVSTETLPVSGTQTYAVTEIGPGVLLVTELLPFKLSNRSVVLVTVSGPVCLKERSFEWFERQVAQRCRLPDGYGFAAEQNHHRTPYLVLRGAWFQDELTPKKLRFVLNSFLGMYRGVELVAAHPPQTQYSC